MLGGRLAPLDGIGPDALTVDALVTRVTDGAMREVILATNPSLEGEATALYVQRRLASVSVTVARIARGLPVGGDLEYADTGTIAQACTKASSNATAIALLAASEPDNTKSSKVDDAIGT